jgi:hypothetical protein
MTKTLTCVRLHNVHLTQISNSHASLSHPEYQIEKKRQLFLILPVMSARRLRIKADVRFNYGYENGQFFFPDQICYNLKQFFCVLFLGDGVEST